MSLTHQQNARVFQAMADENRLRILELLRNGEKCACRLQAEMHIGQSTLSHHMRILCSSGIVKSRKEGKWVHYSIAPHGSKQARCLLCKLTMVQGAKEPCMAK